MKQFPLSGVLFLVDFVEFVILWRLLQLFGGENTSDDPLIVWSPNPIIEMGSNCWTTWVYLDGGGGGGVFYSLKLVLTGIILVTFIIVFVETLLTVILVVRIWPESLFLKVGDEMIIAMVPHCNLPHSQLNVNAVSRNGRQRRRRQIRNRRNFRWIREIH